MQALLKKAATLDIRMICPLHGPVWRKNIGWFVDKYSKWSSYTPEQEGSVLIAYSSVYGHTENAAQVLATMLAGRGVRNIAMYDVSVTHPSYVVAEAFRCSHLVFASTTYNAGIFCNMETVLTDLKAHNLQNRTVGIIQNGSWAPTSGSLMREVISQMKNMGPISGIIEKLPAQFQQAAAHVNDKDAAKQIRRTEGIINSMTPKERRNPEIIKASRKRRIAAGAGVTVQEVNRLLKQFEQTRDVMKHMQKGGMAKMMRALGQLGGRFGGFGRR